VASDAEAEGLIARLNDWGYRTVTTVEHQPSGRLAAARLANRESSSTLVDLLFGPRRVLRHRW
jgi:hypothetical protein